MSSMSELAKPKLRFNGFNSSWKNYFFHETFLILKSNSLSRDDLNDTEGKIKNIHYGDIHTKFRSLLDITKENIPFINDDMLEKVKNMSFCEEGDLIFADASEDYKDIGKAIEIVNLDNQNVLSGLHTILVKKKFNISLGLCGYLFQSWKIRKQIMFFSQGTKVLGLPKKYLEKINLYIPENISEQQKIVSSLSFVDKKIELLIKKHEFLEKYKKGLMQKIFSQEIRFKQDDGSDFPDWVNAKLKTYIKERKNKNKNNLIKKVLSVSNKRGFIAQEEQFEDRRVASTDTSNYRIVRCDDFAYNPSRINVGSIARLSNYKEGIVSPMYVVFYLEELDLSYFENLIRTHRFSYFVQSNCSGSVRDSLSFKSLSEFEFNFPSLLEQKKISSFFKSIDKKINLIKLQIEKTQTFKKGLLQQMFV